MTLVIADRVRETSTSTGTSTFVLAGAVVGYQSFFSAIGNANTTYYTISNQGTSEWEVGIGTISTGSLTRTTVLASSNAGSLVNFSAGTKDVFGTYPAEKAVYLDASGNVSLSGSLTVAGSATLSGGTANGVAYLNGSKVLTTGSALTFNGSVFGLNGSGMLQTITSTGDFSSTGHNIKDEDQGL